MPSSSSHSPLWRLVAALSPLALCLVLAWLVTAGPLGLGGGEKDVLLVVPVALWSVVFAVASLVMWARGASLARASQVASLVAFAMVVIAFVLLVALTWR